MKSKTVRYSEVVPHPHVNEITITEASDHGASLASEPADGSLDRHILPDLGRRDCPQERRAVGRVVHAEGADLVRSASKLRSVEKINETSERARRGPSSARAIGSSYDSPVPEDARA